ncbi:MAG: SPOR domain-containing protein [Blastocatellia bacterium]
MKNLAERETVASQRIYVALVALLICLCPLTVNAQASRIKGYAVQVAALSSQESAEELVRGLSARGINAYWVGGVSYGVRGAAQTHRVRVGNFPTIATANTYAEKLLGAGLVESYAIAAYEPPAKAGFISNGKAHTFAQKYPGRQFGPEVIDVVAAIGARGWLLLSSRSINLTVRDEDSALSRELARLATAMNSRGWSLNNNVVKFLAAPDPVNIAPLSNRIGANAPPPSRASSSSSNTAAVKIGREDSIPSSSTSVGSPISRARIYDPPRLQGSIEMRGGRMWMTLRNADSERDFSGVARISLSNDDKQQDVTPVQFTLPPDKEASFPLDGATLTNGAWILMVYDQDGVARLIRGASLAPPRASAQAFTNSTTTVNPNFASQVPPSYVTGVYDATNWTQPQISPQIQGAEPQDVPVSEAADMQNEADSVDVGAAGSSARMPQMETGPEQVVVTPRQIALTNENVTLELVISAQNPIKSVTVTLRAGDFQDVRQVFIPTSRGRVPFLIPVAHASRGLYYEVKNEAQRVLANGGSDLRSLSK